MDVVTLIPEAYQILLTRLKELEQITLTFQRKSWEGFLTWFFERASMF